MMNFNIQLFADAQTNTTGTMSVEMKTFYEKRLIDQAEPRLVHDQFADYYPVPQNGGKTIEFRKYDSLPKASTCLLYTSPSPRDRQKSRMPSSA